MALFQEGASPSSAMETSNFAHVIFQDVGKSFPPSAALECRYTLTPFFSPHHRDWVGIFKVGWSTARDYYTFQWTPRPETQPGEGGGHHTLLFQGYYLPKDDGEFYQFCYVTHSGEVRGASTPFQFRSATPPADELLALEDDSNSDILVITSRTSLLEQKVEEAQRRQAELREELHLLQQEKEELQHEKERLRREREEERETCTRLRAQNQALQQSSQSLQEEKKEAQRRQEEASARLRQLEEDLLELTQRGLQKETEIDCLRDRLKKLNVENDSLESQLKMERDERELCKLHLKNTELQKARLCAELQVLRSVDMNKEINLAELQEQLGRLQREASQSAALPGENARLKEQLRQVEEQLQAVRQQAAMLAGELRDTAGVRDHTMAELYRTRLEADALRTSLGHAHTEYACLQEQLESLRTSAQQDPGAGAREAELQQEGEELRLRLQMAAEHYKEKYRECHRLRKQLAQLQGDPKRRSASETAAEERSEVTEATAEVRSEVTEAAAEERSEVTEAAAEERSEVTEAAAEERSEVTEAAAEERSEVTEAIADLPVGTQSCVEATAPELPQSPEPSTGVALQDGLACVQTAQTQTEEPQEQQEGSEGAAGLGLRADGATPMLLQYPIPYPQCPAELQFGNPYSALPAGAAGSEPPAPGSRARTPLSPPSWDTPVVCIQPSRNLNPPDGLEDPEQHSDGGDGDQAADPPSPAHNGTASFCFDSSEDTQKRCPLCEVVFPPHYEQRQFEEHVESHWKVCPVCSQQFPLDCQQHLFQRHVNTHFDGNVLNFD